MTDLDEHLGNIQGGDARAFGRWMACAEPVLRGSLRRFATVVDTEALLQESLLRVWQVAPRHQPDGQPNSLLRLGLRISRNLAVSEIRRTRSEPVDPATLEQSFPEPDAGDPGTPDPLLRRLIQACRDRLPAKPAEALMQRISSQGAEPDAVLAARSGMQLNTFLQNFTRARKLLLQCLEAQGVDVRQLA